jgi:Domain of unknown function (DUF1931)
MMIAALQSNKSPTTHVMSVAKFERFFRIAAGLDVDKQDLKRYSEFINQKVYDLLLRAEAAAKANGRVIIEPFDLPITKGLQESIHEFKKIDEQIELQPSSRSSHRAAAAGPRLWRRHREQAARGHWRAERGTRARLQNHGQRSEESANRALAALLPHFRSADVTARPETGLAGSGAQLSS